MSRWSRLRRADGSRARGLSPVKDEIGFGPVAYARLAQSIEDALTKARTRDRAVVASITVHLPAICDPFEHVAAAVADGERWTSFTQTARGNRSLATLGAAVVVIASGRERFDRVAADCALALDAAETDDLADDTDAPSSAGATWVGGFGFFEDDPWNDAWRSFPAAEFVLPRAAISRKGDHVRLTLNVSVNPESETADLMAGVEEIVDRLDPEGDFGDVLQVQRSGREAAVSSSASAEHYEQSVRTATEMIRKGELEKIVLAREVVLRRDDPIDPFAALRMLHERFPECTCFAVGSGTAVFLGASPELLIRREGRRASTMALAGSMRRGADEETDRHLGHQLLDSVKDNEEHAIVVRGIERTLGRLSAWVAVGEKPELIKVKNIQHLATPIRAQLTEPRPAIELAGILHPTPAVGGEPWHAAGPAIKSLEGFDRGWYAGAVGWMDQLEDGEFHVALRSALVEGSQARLFVGAGIVGESDPSEELAETETKLQALLPVLSRC